MIEYRTKWKEISLEEYNKLNKGLTEFEILLNNKTSKELDLNRFDIPKGIGILETSRIIGEINSKKHPDDYYKYYKNDGIEMVVIGGEKFISEFNKVFEDYGK